MLVLALVAIPTLGILITETTVSSGLARYEEDRERLSAARKALNAAARLNDQPVARLLFPAARVESVDHEPGSEEPIADYTARVRVYTWFRIPAQAVEIWCGGWAYGGARPLQVDAAAAPRAGPGPLRQQVGPPPASLPDVRIAIARADLDGDGDLEEIEIRGLNQANRRWGPSIQVY